MRRSLIGFIALASVGCSGCAGALRASSMNTTVSADATSKHSAPVATNLKVVDTRSRLVKQKVEDWTVTAMQVPGRENLSAVDFVNEVEGWVAGGGGLYKTTDTGHTWQQVQIDRPENARIEHIEFVTPLNGWVVIQKSGTNVWDHYNDFTYWVEHTVDGGRTWQSQFEENQAEISNISFINDREGWLSGVRFLTPSPVRSALLLFHTLDHGQHWVDASGELNRLAAQVWRRHATETTGTMPAIAEVYNDLVDDSVTDIHADSSLKATILTYVGNVYGTDNGGQSWQVLAEQSPDYLSWSRYTRLGSNAVNSLRLLQTADSSRGMYSRLKIQQNDSWKQYTLPNAYFRDVVYLSGQRIFVCGYTPVTSRKPSDVTAGAILYSSDGGITWSSLYHDPDVANITSLATTDGENVWAVGDNGLVLHITPTSKQPSNLAARARVK